MSSGIGTPETRPAWLFGAVLLFTVPLTAGAAPQEGALVLSDRTEVPLQIYPARGRQALLWLPSEVGRVAAEDGIARALARAGVEVWRADVLGARFLPEARSSLEEVPAEDVSALIAHVADRTGKAVYLIAAERGAVPALRGAQHWKRAHPDAAALAGAVLLSPNLYVAAPEPGAEAHYLPVVAETRLRIFILQPERSPWYWRLERLKTEFQRGGSTVATRVLPEVRDRFYFRPDASAREDAQARALARLVTEALSQLQKETGP